MPGSRPARLPGMHDLVNRAITLYEFIDAQLRDGRDLIVRDQETSETQLVRLL